MTPAIHERIRVHVRGEWIEVVVARLPVDDLRWYAGYSADGALVTWTADDEVERIETVWRDESGSGNGVRGTATWLERSLASASADVATWSPEKRAAMRVIETGEQRGRCACGDPSCAWELSGPFAECPNCVFRYDRSHALHSGAYSCPNCGHGCPDSIADLADRLADAQRCIATQEGALAGWRMRALLAEDAEWQRWLDLAWSDRELRAQAANELERKLGEAVATITHLRDQLGRERMRGALVGDVLRLVEALREQGAIEDPCIETWRRAGRPGLHE